MRKRVLGIVLIVILFLPSCKTDNTPAVSSGSWTFKSVTYNDTKGIPVTWDNVVVSLIATNTSNSYPQLVISDNETKAFLSGTYLAGSGSGYINLQVTDSSGNVFMVMPNDTGTVSVNVNSGKISLSSAGIRMVNFGFAPYTDTSILTFNITQTY